MKNNILFFASILILASCSNEDGLVEEALSTKEVSLTKEGVEDTNITSKSGTKVSICHKNAGEIVVDSAALATHLAHGDAVDMDGDGYYTGDNPCSETDCDDTTYSENNSCVQIGDLREGGIVFWIDPSDNTRGKVCLLSNAPLALNWDAARSFCSNLTLTVNSIEYNDWYLPSNDELNLMWINLADSDGDGFSNIDDPNNLGGFLGFSYWSSTEINDTNASAQEFGQGTQFSSPKIFRRIVRAVRAF